MKRMKTLLVGGFLVSLLGAGMAVPAGVGELDSSFGGDGRVATSLNQFGDQAYALAVQPDGRILVAGSSSNGANLDFAVVRYTGDGALDPSFNLDGTVTTMVGREDDEIAAIAVQDDGYIVAAGYSMTESGRDFTLVRYTPDGLLDHSFGLGGIVITEYGSLDDEFTSLAVDSEGRLVVAGYTTGTAGRAVIVARYLPGGNLDLTFGDQGMSLIGVGEDTLARSLAVDDQGRILVAGSYLYQDRTELMVLRLTAEGELDNSFGEEGLAAALATGVPTDGFGIDLLDNGAILVAGAVGVPGELDSALFKYTPEGQPDRAFGDSGVLVTEASQEDDLALAVAARGNVVCLSGYTTLNGVREFLFVSHQLAADEAAGVSFALKGAGGTTGLRISERQDLDSSSDYAGTGSQAVFPLQTIVNTTAFGATDDISYAVAVQADGRAVAAGLTAQGETTSFAVARYASAAAANSLGVSWIVTKEPTEVTRTGAFTGGVIADSGLTISQRGVVFSIAPDPVLDEGTGTSDNPPNGTDTTPPSVSSTDPANGAVVAANSDVRINWSESIDCSTVTTTSITSTSPGWTRKSCSGSQAVFTTSGQANSTQYSVTVTTNVSDAAGNKMSTNYTFSYSTSGPVSGTLPQAEHYAGAIGNLLVGTAHAQTTDTTGTTTTDTTDTTDTTTSSGVFDLSTPEYALEGYTKDGAGSGSYSAILTELRPSTFYYVRAYAKTSDGMVYYGNQTGFKTADACFIATAAYGSLFHPCVTLLREFRDSYLLTSLPGRLFVKLYYRHSPPLADFISTHPVLRPVVQVALLPAVGLGWLLLHLGGTGLVLLGGVATLIGWQTRRFSRKGPGL